MDLLFCGGGRGRGVYCAQVVASSASHDKAEVSLTPDSRAVLTIAFEHRHKLSPDQPTLQSLIQRMTDAEKFLLIGYPFRWSKDDSSGRWLPKLAPRTKGQVEK